MYEKWYCNLLILILMYGIEEAMQAQDICTASDKLPIWICVFDDLWQYE